MMIDRESDFMREEYNISELNPRKNPYASRLKKQITILSARLCCQYETAPDILAVGRTENYDCQNNT